MPGLYSKHEVLQRHRELQVEPSRLTPWVEVGPNTRVSELRMTGSTAGVVFVLDDNEEGFRLSPGGPPVVLSGITFNNTASGTGGPELPAVRVRDRTQLTITDCSFSGHEGPAIVIEGGETIIRSSDFVHNKDTAVLIQGGFVHIESSAFVHNGDPDAKGGAMRQEGGNTNVESSRFEDNFAHSGGAIFIAGGTISIHTTTLKRNAAATGAALSVAISAHVLMRNDTIISRNLLIPGGSGGRSVHVDGMNSKVAYVLPLPLGHWLTNAAPCSADSTEAQIRRSNFMCAEQLYDTTLAALLPGASDDDYPLICGPGVFGNSSIGANQTSPQCAGPCPDGYFCPSKTIQPQLCWEGHFCVQGSSAPVPCADGTYTTRTGLKSQAECSDCPAGSWCRGGSEFPCAVSTYSTSRSGQCEDCPQHYTTLQDRTTSADGCVCKAGRIMTYTDAEYVAVANALEYQLNYTERHCDVCPDARGVDCSAPGLALETLRITKGHWRSHNLSFEVRQCAESDYCVGTYEDGGDADLTRNGTVDIVNGTGIGCATGHLGPYCALCIAAYVMHDEGCKLCDGSLTAFIVFGSVCLSLIILSGCCCRAKRLKELSEAAVEDVMTGGFDDVFASNVSDEMKAMTAKSFAGKPTTTRATAQDEDGVAMHPEGSKPAAEARSRADSVLSPRSISSFARSSFALVQSASPSISRSTSMAKESARQAALKHGFTEKRVKGLFVKSKILISLIQVITQLAVIFDIPYPPIYSKTMDYLSVMSLDFLDLMPLKCSVTFNHDHLLVSSLKACIRPSDPPLTGTLWSMRAYHALIMSRAPQLAVCLHGSAVGAPHPFLCVPRAFAIFCGSQAPPCTHTCWRKNR